MEISGTLLQALTGLTRGEPSSDQVPNKPLPYTEEERGAEGTAKVTFFRF